MQFPPWGIYSFPFFLPILITLFLILEVIKVRPELSFKIYAYVIHLSYQTSFKNQVSWVLRGVESRSWIEKKKIICLGYINTYIYIFHSQELVFIMKELITLYFSYCLSDLPSLLLSAMSHLWQLHPPLWIAEWVSERWVDSGQLHSWRGLPWERVVTCWTKRRVLSQAEVPRPIMVPAFVTLPSHFTDLGPGCAQL